MEVIFFQIGIFIIIFISSFFGKSIRNITTIAISIFTILAIFTGWLFLLQYLTIYISYKLTNIYFFNYKKPDIVIIEREEINKVESKKEKNYAFIFIIIFAIISTISVYNFKYRNSLQPKIAESPDKTNDTNKPPSNKSFQILNSNETKFLDEQAIESTSNTEKTYEQDILLDLAKKHFLKYKNNLETESLYVGLENPYFGDFTGDGRDDIVFYYSLEPKDGGNYLGGQGLMVYENLKSDIDFIAQYEAPLRFSFSEIKKNTIYIDKVEYDENDPRCCPSILTKYRLIIDGYQIREIKDPD